MQRNGHAGQTGRTLGPGRSARRQYGRTRCRPRCGASERVTRPRSQSRRRLCPSPGRVVDGTLLVAEAPDVRLELLEATALVEPNRRLAMVAGVEIDLASPALGRDLQPLLDER